MNKRIIGGVLAVLTLAIMVAPAMAIGPEKAENNPFRVVALGGTNVQLWLPNGVMNEWINNPVLPGPLRVQIKDAAKFQLEAVVANSPLEVLITENQWFYLNQDIFMALLGAVGADPSIAFDYSEGAYMKIIYVGWEPTTP